MDPLTSNSRIQNIGNIAQSSNIERNQYSLPTGHGYHYSYGPSKTSKGKKNIALTALTLLAFMFFLNLLQNCLQDQMNMNQASQVMVISSRLKQQKEADKRKDGAEETVHFEKPYEEDEEKTYLKIAKSILNTDKNSAN